MLQNVNIRRSWTQQSWNMRPETFLLVFLRLGKRPHINEAWSGLLPSSVLKTEDDKILDIFQIYFPLIFNLSACNPREFPQIYLLDIQHITDAKHIMIDHDQQSSKGWMIIYKVLISLLALAKPLNYS